MRSVYWLPIIRIVLIVLFTYTGVSKLADGPLFERQMMGQPFPEPFIALVTNTLPYFELFTVFCLVYRPLQRIGLVLAFGQMVVFTGYVGLVWLHAFERVPCSCGGVLQQMDWGEHLVFNLVFLAISGWGWWLGREERQLSGE